MQSEMLQQCSRGCSPIIQQIISSDPLILIWPSEQAEHARGCNVEALSRFTIPFMIPQQKAEEEAPRAPEAEPEEEEEH